MNWINFVKTFFMRLAIVGATGLVGGEMMRVVAERKFSFDELILVASDKSQGRMIAFEGKEYRVHTIAEALEKKPHIALFSAGGKTSKMYAQAFAAVGTVVIDNSSAWRMDPDKKLIVPEVNGQILTEADRIIANPNCSTIQLVVALEPLRKRYGIKRVVVSTYQAVTGTGVIGVRQLMDERQGIADGPKVYAHPIDLNVIPHGGDFLADGSTTEEEKLLKESRKIMGDDSIGVSATVVRVPVTGGHSESVNVELASAYEIAEIRQILTMAQGVRLLDNPSQNEYPTPLQAAGNDWVWVGRLRRDESVINGLNMWVVSDNLRKGAATNAVQIAELVRTWKFSI
jgi:aspartate-semialdehyde dehydrogenase